MARLVRRPAVFMMALLLAACASSTSGSTKTTATTRPKAPAPSWPAPPDPMARARAAGLVPETAESLQHHVHSHLDVFVDGAPVTVPGGIGIDTGDPRVHRGVVDGKPAFGGIVVPCDQPCISPPHTHDATGILHTESATNRDNTLGELFVEWAVPLDASCVSTYCRPASPIAIYLDGKPFTGDPRSIPLTDQEEIAIVIGRPPAHIPATGDFSQA